MDKCAVVVGASSGIGEAIARELARRGWRLGLAARRVPELEAVARDLRSALVAYVDLADTEGTRLALTSLADQLGGVDLWVLNAGTGEENIEFAWGPEETTIRVNVLGFAAMADVAIHHCLGRGHGRIVGVSSIARFMKRPPAVSYAASKAFVSVYLDGLRDLARRRGSKVTVTEACPGFVRTPMMMASKPFWVATPEKAARQIVDGTITGHKLVYVTRRWRIIAWALRLMPR
ncbi:MAG: SDR family NAD(P)-dependent oxidoreductase [Erythrobacteraceae bacterium]|jgi:short-subunit dehydrogenase